MFEHIGRLTGARRYVVLEVTARPAPGRYVVTSGFGGSAPWYRSVSANPSVHIYERSRRPTSAIASVLTAEQGAAVLAAYVVAHPRDWQTLKPVLDTTLAVEIGETAPRCH